MSKLKNKIKDVITENCINTENAAKIWAVSLVSGENIKVVTLEQPARHENKHCDGCTAPCCKLYLPVLTGEEFINRKFNFKYSNVPDWMKDQVNGAQYLATINENQMGCIYHDWETNKCKAWPNLPKSCWSYDCRRDDRPEMINFVNNQRKSVWREP